MPRWTNWPDTPYQLNRASPQMRGLVGWWPTAGRLAGSLLDPVGGATAVATGQVARTTSAVGPMSSFAGTGATYYTIQKTPQLAALTGAFSVSAWVRTGNIQNGTDYAIAGSGTWYPHETGNWHLSKPAWSGMQLDFCVSDGSATFWPVDTNEMSAVSTNTLYHFIGINVGGASGGLILWMNGRRSTTWAGPTGAINQAASTITIGTGGDSNFPWLGAIGDVRIYNYALDDAEAWALWEPSTRWDLYEPVYRAWAVKGVAAAAITGTGSATLGDLTGAGTATNLISGAGSASLAGLTGSATGTVSISGAANQSLGALTGTGTGAVLVNGSANITLGILTGSATATCSVAGIGSAALGTLTSTASGTVSIAGEATVTLGVLTGSATATLLAVTTASGQATLGALTGAATATVVIQAAANQSLAALTGMGGGTVSATGSASVTLSSLTGISTGVTPISAQGSATLSALTGAATLNSPPQSLAEGAVTLGALTGAGSATVDVVALGQIFLGTLTGTGQAEVSIEGTATATLGELTGISLAQLILTAQGLATLDALTGTATAGEFTEAMHIEHARAYLRLNNLRARIEA